MDKKMRQLMKERIKETKDIERNKERVNESLKEWVSV